MTQPFTFPPPPPPPPTKKDVKNGVEEDRHKDLPRANRGRAGFRGNGRGFRNTGPSAPQGSRKAEDRSTSYTYHKAATVNRTNNLSETKPPQISNRDSNETGRKRDHGTAFQSPNISSTAQRSRPFAPPSVPSFGLDLENLLPKRPITAPAVPEKQKKVNLFGLTPNTDGVESSDEDDEGEESRLPTTTLQGASGVEFEYRGQTSTLRTPEEIAAWIAERRKNFPTQERVEKAKKEALEKRRKWEAERQARLETAKEAAKARQEERLKRMHEQEVTQIREKLLAEHVNRARSAPQDEGTKADKLRLKAQKAAERLRKAENALRKAEAQSTDMEGLEQSQTGNILHLDNLLAEVDDAALHFDSQSVTNIKAAPTEAQDLQSQNIEEYTSSSGSSEESDLENDSDANDDEESASDSSPEVESSKLSGPEKVAPPPRAAPATSTQPLCRNFSKYGRCRHGKQCRFLHEKPDKHDKKKKVAASQSMASGTRRKRLFQVMVEKEEEEERKKVLQAIIALGAKGALEDVGGDKV